MSQLDKKLCLITGASGGIGEAIAKALANEGYTLILSARNSRKLDLLAMTIPGSHVAKAADITVQSSREDLIDFANSLGSLELVVNCAGISQFGRFAESTTSEMDALLSVNVLAVMSLNQLALNRAGARPLTIVNVGSALGAIGHPGYVNYCTSKFALRGFCEALAREYANTNKTIQYLAPRATNTAINSPLVEEMNSAMGNAVDQPSIVAQHLLNLIQSGKRRMTIGWPERLFVRLNGAFPELVDNAFGKKIDKIKTYFKPTTEKFS